MNDDAFQVALLIFSAQVECVVLAQRSGDKSGLSLDDGSMYADIYLARKSISSSCKERRRTRLRKDGPSAARPR